MIFLVEIREIYSLIQMTIITDVRRFAVRQISLAYNRKMLALILTPVLTVSTATYVFVTKPQTKVKYKVRPLIVLN